MANLTNSSGVVTQSYTYDGFGNVIAKSGSNSNTCQFLTKELDQSGLVYFGSRYYYPRIGRFISPDPSGMSDGPNLYLYCLNDPINAVDLWGLCIDKTLGREPTEAEIIQLRMIFPDLTEFRITGEPTESYNCIAWTLGITNRWIDPTPTISGMDILYASSGLKIVTQGKAQVALFVREGVPQHGAVKINGDWYESKLGSWYRIVHKLKDLEGVAYGKVEKFYGK